MSFKHVHSVLETYALTIDFWQPITGKTTNDFYKGATSN